RTTFSGPGTGSWPSSSLPSPPGSSFTSASCPSAAAAKAASSEALPSLSPARNERRERRHSTSPAKTAARKIIVIEIDCIPFRSTIVSTRPRMTTAEASKPVPAKPRRWWLLLFIALVLFGLLTSAFYWLAYIASAPDMSRVDHATTDELWAMGTNVIPVLAARARLRDNIFTTFYAKLYSKFPGELRRSFPRPVNRTPIRMHAMRAIAELGPLPALINDLHDPEAAYEAAICLGYMGTNARAAIPALIDTLRHSAAGASPADEAKWRPDDRSIQQSTGKYSLDHNRAMSARALGRIGIATPEVTIALARAWNDTNEWVCANAAEAIGDLGPAMAGQVPELIAGLQDHDNRALSAKLLAL